MGDDRGFLGFWLASKKIFFPNCLKMDDRNFLITENKGMEGRVKNICGKYMKIEMEMKGKKFKWK